MARSKKKAPQTLEGAEEFLGADPEQEAIEKIAAAKAAAATEAEQDATKGHNGGPILDENAWMRATNEYVAEQIEIDTLMEKVAEVRGRISSIKKVAEKCNVDWDVVKLYAKYAKRERQGESGAVVTEMRRLGALMRLMGSPLHTQFGLFAEEPTAAATNGAARPAMDAELQGQHAYRNSEPEGNNPFPPGSDEHVDWQRGWRNAQEATARAMGAPAAGNA
jgi:hypothetical protein